MAHRTVHLTLSVTVDEDRLREHARASGATEGWAADHASMPLPEVVAAMTHVALDPDCVRSLEVLEVYFA